MKKDYIWVISSQLLSISWFYIFCKIDGYFLELQARKRRTTLVQWQLQKCSAFRIPKMSQASKEYGVCYLKIKKPKYKLRFKYDY